MSDASDDPVPRPRETTRDLDTPTGPGRATITPGVGERRGTLILSHGAGGGIGASDLQILREHLPAQGWGVVLVEQPWRVAGKKVAGPPRTLDAAWVKMLAALRRSRLPRPWVVGGRSAGARVACRTAETVGADAVLCLSFPLVPPGAEPEKSRAAELLVPIEVGLPTLVVQGEKDPFGAPGDVRAVLDRAAYGRGGETRAYVAAAPGTHSFGARPVEVLEAVRAFLADL